MDFANWWWPYLVGLLTGYGVPRLLSWMSERDDDRESEEIIAWYDLMPPAIVALDEVMADPGPLMRAGPLMPDSSQPDICRYATDPDHTCRRRDGRPVRPGVEACWVEASAQIREQGRW